MFGEHQAKEHFRSLLNFALTLKKIQKCLEMQLHAHCTSILTDNYIRTGTSLKRTPKFGL